MKIIHIILSLETGGAEIMLSRLALDFKKDPNIDQTVISLRQLGNLGEKLKKMV